MLSWILLNFTILAYSAASSDPCKSDEYACPNEDKCIPWQYFCDGMEDCSDGSDEIKADSKSTGILCQRHRFTCLLPQEYASRKSLFCKDRVECRPEDFACADGSRCIRWGEFCNDHQACWDNSDELPYEPGMPGIPCRMGRSYLSRVCLLPEKYAHRKEETCEDISICKSDEFACLDGSGCVPARDYCDGEPHCKDGSDEISIDSDIQGFACRPTFQRQMAVINMCKLPQIYAAQKDYFCEKETRCKKNEFACLDGTGCVHWPEYCDISTPRCRDKSDAIKINSKFDGIRCRVHYYGFRNLCKLPRIYARKEKEICVGAPRCRRNEFPCRDGTQCWEASEFCDGLRMCRDESDEAKPTKRTKIICRRGKNFCALPRRLLRRKDMFCDEIVKCLPEQFACSDGEKCLPKDQFCDGTAQCSDGSDEILSTGDNGTPCLGEHGGVCVLPGNEIFKKDVLCRVQCKDDEFECRDRKECLSANWFCDGESYCSDGSDHTRSKYLPANMTGIPCRYDDWVCILPEDQAHKKQNLCKKNPECNDNEFACLDGSRCIPAENFCNGSPNCFYDGSDEISPASNVTGVLCMGRVYEYFEPDIHRENVCILPEGQAWKKNLLCRSLP